MPFISRYSAGREIYNYLEISHLFPTSGQPNERELKELCEAGYDVVVNLAPTSVFENSVVREAEILAENGTKYIHLPVDFKNPTEEDFRNFVEAVQQYGEDKVWVHCAANMRVSAFTYRYRVSVLGEDEAIAKKDLFKIWKPFGVWNEFIGRDS